MTVPAAVTELKIVYIAGPYGDAGGYLAIDHNIAMAREAAAALAAAGVGFLCPHLNSAHFEAIVPGVPVDFWYRMDIALLECCDGVLVLPGWEMSKGTNRELAVAEAQGMPVFYYGPLSEETYEGEWGNLLAWAKS